MCGYLPHIINSSRVGLHCTLLSRWYTALDTKEPARWTRRSCCGCETGVVSCRVRTVARCGRYCPAGITSAGFLWRRGRSHGSSGKNRYVGVSHTVTAFCFNNAGMNCTSAVLFGIYWWQLWQNCKWFANLQKQQAKRILLNSSQHMRYNTVVHRK
jgi:hypothetical protein